jgi:hypothetical protein
MIISVHLDITRTDISLITLILNAVIMSLFPIVLTIPKLDTAVIRRSESQESVVQGFRTLLVPLQMADDLFFFIEDFIRALNVVTVIVLTLIFDLTLLVVTIQV